MTLNESEFDEVTINENSVFSDFTKTNISIADIKIYVFLFFCLILSLVISLFLPDNKKIVSKIVEIPRNNVFSLKLSDLNPFYYFLKMKIRFILKEPTKEYSSEMNTNVKCSYSKSRTNHKFTKKNVLVHFKSGSDEKTTNWHTFFYERIIDFNTIKINFTVLDDMKKFKSAELVYIHSNMYNFAMQFIIRVLFTIVMIVLAKVYVVPSKNQNMGFEYVMTNLFIWFTLFYNNVVSLIMFYFNDILIVSFNNVIISIYCGFIVFYTSFINGKCSEGPVTTENFIYDKLYFSTFYGILVLVRNILKDFGEIHNPFVSVQKIDRKFIVLEQIVFIIYIIRELKSLYEAYRRIWHSEPIKFINYVVITIMISLVLVIEEDLLSTEYTNFRFIAKFTLANINTIFAAFVAYSHEMCRQVLDENECLLNKMEESSTEEEEIVYVYEEEEEI